MTVDASAAAPVALTPEQNASAKAVINGFLGAYGLTNLASWAWGRWQETGNIDLIMLEMYQTPEFKTRFPAFDDLAKQNRAITPTDYVNYEKTIGALLQANGIPKGMYDSPDQIAKMLINHVDPPEAQQRIQDAAAAAYTVPEEVRTAMRDLYGVGSGGLIGLFLDADKQLPILQKQFAAAQIAGAGLQQDIGVGKTQAEQLASQGVTYAQALAGLGTAAQQQPLEKGFGETISQEDLIKAQFGDTAAQTTATRVMKGRLARFGQGGSLAETQQGVAGLGSSSTT